MTVQCHSLYMYSVHVDSIIILYIMYVSSCMYIFLSIDIHYMYMYAFQLGWQSYIWRGYLWNCS